MVSLNWRREGIRTLVGGIKPVVMPAITNPIPPVLAGSTLLPLLLIRQVIGNYGQFAGEFGVH